MKQGLSLRVSQHLALTPQLQQSIRLLQLSTLEMAQEVEQMLDDNPFLERASDEAEREAFGLEHSDAPVSLGDRMVEWSEADGPASETDPGFDPAEDAIPLESSWEGDGCVDLRPDDSEWGGDAPARHGSRDDDDTLTAADLASEHQTLQAHLHEQALALRLNDDERCALYFLIESLNEDGYLAEPLEALARALLTQEMHARALSLDAAEQAEREAHWLQTLRTALHWLQHMEPAGVGARDLAECLRLQIMELRNSPVAQAALAMCQQPLELLARRDTRRLAQLCQCPEDTVRQALALIARLEPKPGRRFADVARQTVIPDVIVTPQGRGFKVQLNPEVMPRLRVQDVYANALRGSRGETGAGLQQRLQEARWFIKNIQQRFDTILRVASAIVERQRSFFLHGELAMRPLVLREIADELGLHESTISRVTTAKYMATPFGTYELKYFFGSALGTETGGNASSTAVRALIKQLVASEDPKKPLSDNQLSDLLKEQGIECARRTVAKYREALKIAPAHLRKAL
ncbi:RNA polymerase factor sigma-54 [Tepidicella xavieri]|uniref:RNA polymerase sigma-54 factor n=1 Tax=Tepidicella xavieri TaxID=360241 RepID=A0A4V3D6T3_9BURK|nr:RNA polymerase factor sigma-54 [Tepidicella xavieri]TDQ45217.1 RNA polymerase RpoN-/SigL-like sigma 54 subunit [Tepidicella xavieri]